jgi:CrcB protein
VIRSLATVSLGGAVGALARWGLGEVWPSGGGFPWTTFAVNVSGCLLIGLLPALALLRARPVLAAAVGPGLLGGYTTMSAYAEDTRALLADDRAGTAVAYLLATLLACVAAVLLGRRLTGQAPSS